MTAGFVGGGVVAGGCDLFGGIVAMVTVVIADCASMDTDCFSDNIRCIRKVHGACPYSDSRAPLRTIVAAGDPLTLTHRQRYAYSETVTTASPLTSQSGQF